MIQTIPSASCGSEQGPQLVLMDNGALYRRETPDDTWALYDFNQLYEGYYPHCRMTALAYTGSFWLGAVTDDGRPILFSSLMGGVWTERNMVMDSPEIGFVMPEGRILRILWDATHRQMHLVMSSGQLITLPDCAKCVRIRTIAKAGLLDGRMDGRNMIVTCTDNSELQVSLDELMQFRASWSWADNLIQQGAVVIDLRPDALIVPGDIPWQALRFSPSEAWHWLQQQDAETRVFVVCGQGLQSDELVKTARDSGYPYTWSLGGTNALYHVE